jgi:hypothetical protein
MLKLQRNRADVLQRCPAEAEDISSIYSQRRKDVNMPATTTAKYRETKRKERGKRKGKKG